MPAAELTIDEILLDTENPRIRGAHRQRDVLQKVLDDQGEKLAVLAESIVADGLNPVDRFLVMPEKAKTSDAAKHAKHYVVLEGNRRIAALKILSNPSVLVSLDLKEALQKRLERAAKDFKAEDVEPLSCFIMPDRASARQWLLLRHTGANQGKGVVDWSALAAQQFKGTAPALQALDFVKAFGQLSQEQNELLGNAFPITTLDRLLSTKDVRALVGVDVREGVLLTLVPPTEVLKPLKKMVLDLADGSVNVSKLKNKTDQAKYISDLPATYQPDLSHKVTPRPVEDCRREDFATAEKRARAPKIVKSKPAGERSVLIPRSAMLKIGDSKVSSIAAELRALKVDKSPHAVAVLFRVFLELSVDCYVDRHHLPTQFVDPKSQRKIDLNLATKLKNIIAHIVTNGGVKKDYMSVERALHDDKSPLSIDLLHAYVHNRFVTPKSRDLIAAWDDARRFFEVIWS